MLRQLWRSETCLPRRVVGFLVPSSFCPQKGQPARFLGPLWVIMVEHWSEKEHVLILRSRRIAVFNLKVCHFICGSQILLLCCEVRIVRSSALSYPWSSCSKGSLLFYRGQMEDEWNYSGHPGLPPALLIQLIWFQLTFVGQICEFTAFWFRMMLQKKFSFLTFCCCSVISLPSLFHSDYVIYECKIEQGSFPGGYSSISLQKEAREHEWEKTGSEE